MSSPSKNPLPPTSSTAATNLSSNPNTSINTTNNTKLADNNHNIHGFGSSLPMPGLSGPANGPIGNLLKGPVDENGKLKDAGLMVGIKLDLEAEVHLTARIRGDILVGLY
ncbi:hypothetical protein EsH8_I_001593 [Colletotrichum jinshuiense]